MTYTRKLAASIPYVWNNTFSSSSSSTNYFSLGDYVEDGEWFFAAVSGYPRYSGSPVPQLYTWEYQGDLTIRPRSHGYVPGNGGSSGYDYWQIGFTDVATHRFNLAGVYGSQSLNSDYRIAQVFYVFDHEPVVQEWVSGVSSITRDLKAGQLVVCMTANVGSTNMTISHQSSNNMYVLDAIATGGEQTFNSGGTASATTFAIMELPASPLTVLESGTEVPVEIEGEYTTGGITPLTIEGIYREATAGNQAHSLVTGADLYYSDYSNEPGFNASEPVTVSLTRTANSGASYSMWVQFPDTVSSVQGLMNHQNGTSETGGNLVYILANSGEIRATDNTGVTIFGYQDGQFHHLCYVHEAGNSIFTLYLDGEQIAYTAHPDATLNTLRFGTLASGSSIYPFQGKMDDLMMTSTVLTAQQVMDIYNAGRSTGTPARVEPL